MATATLENPLITYSPPLPANGHRRHVTSGFVTPEQYLAQERVALNKHEYINGEVREMAGASRSHNIITGKIVTVLTMVCDERDDCEVYPSDFRVYIPAVNRYTYPDVVVVIGEEPQLTDAALDTLLNPTVIVEVLSKSTQDYDRGDKYAAYQTVPSLQECVFVSQDEYKAEVFARDTDTGIWDKTATATGITGSITLRSLDVTVSLSDIYRKVKLSAAPEGDAA